MPINPQKCLAREGLGPRLAAGIMAVRCVNNSLLG